VKRRALHLLGSGPAEEDIETTTQRKRKSTVTRTNDSFGRQKKVPPSSNLRWGGAHKGGKITCHLRNGKEGGVALNQPQVGAILPKVQHEEEPSKKDTPLQGEGNALEGAAGRERGAEPSLLTNPPLPESTSRRTRR